MLKAIVYFIQNVYYRIFVKATEAETMVEEILWRALGALWSVLSTATRLPIWVIGGCLYFLFGLPAVILFIKGIFLLGALNAINATPSEEPRYA